jgi:hypothetical protein
VTRYGLDGPGIESQCGEIFCTCSDQPRRPTSLLYNGYRVSFAWVKRPGHGVDHPRHLVPRLKNEYNYTSTPPLGLRGLFRVTFTFTLTGNIIIKYKLEATQTFFINTLTECFQLTNYMPSPPTDVQYIFLKITH